MRKSIFVSSTFQDFQRERDLLQTKVELRINELLQPSQVSFLDLRWGIDTTGEKNLEKVVSICLEEVRNSYPFYVIMLGDTYGSCVDRKVIRSLYELNGLPYDGEEKSVTQIEIEATGLFENNRDYVLVLDRQSDGPVDPRAAALKKKVLAAAKPENVYTYTVSMCDREIDIPDEEAWIEFIAGRIHTFLMDWPTSEEHPTIERAMEMARQFRGRAELLQELFTAVTTYEKDPIFRVYAPGGSGLTALLSKLMLQLQENGFRMAICEAKTNIPVSFYEALAIAAYHWKVSVENPMDVLSDLDADEKYICILEGMDEIEDDPMLQRLLRRGSWPANVLFILTVRDPLKADFIVDYPTKEDALALFDGTMQEYRKELPKEFHQYFENHISDEMVRQPVFLKEFISALYYLNEEEYKALGSSGNFMEALVALFTKKLDHFPENEQEYIQAVLQQSTESQICVLGLLSVANTLEGKIILGILRSGGIRCDMLDIRIVKERFRDSISCLNGKEYLITRDSFREAVHRCFTPEQLRWLRYLLIAYSGENLGILLIPQNFQIVVAHYLEMEDYELLARLLELHYPTNNEQEENGLIFTRMCNEFGADRPGPHYMALAAEKNAYCSAWLLNYAMAFLTELYIENGTELFAQMYEAVASEENNAEASDLLGLWAFGMGLKLKGIEADKKIRQEMEKRGYIGLTDNMIALPYLTACLQLNTKSAGRIIEVLLERIDIHNEAVHTVLGRILRYTVLMDGNMCAYMQQLRQLFACCEEYLRVSKRKDDADIAVPLLFLSKLTGSPLDNQKAVEEVVERENLDEQPLAVHLLWFYYQYSRNKQAEDWADLIEIVCMTLDDQVPLSTVDLFYVSRYLRRICYRTPTVLASEKAAAYARMLYCRFRELDNSEFYLGKVIEMFYLGGLICVYEGAEQARILLEPLLSDTRIHTSDLLSELNFFKMDAEELIKSTKSAESIQKLEEALKKR